MYKIYYRTVQEKEYGLEVHKVIVSLDGKEVARSQFWSKGAASQWGFRRAKALQARLAEDKKESTVEGEMT